MMTLWVGGRDVGWGQGGCNELIVNNKFEINSGSTNGIGAISSPLTKVTEWYCGANSPDYIAVNSMNQCISSSNAPTLDQFYNHFMRLLGVNGAVEASYQNLNKPIKDNLYLTYTFKAKAGLLSCLFNNNNSENTLNQNPTRVIFGLCSSYQISPNNCFEEYTFPTTQFVLGQQFLSSSIPITIEKSFNSSDLLSDFTQIYIANIGSGLNNGLFNRLAVYDVSLKCKNIGLTDILTTGVCGKLGFTAKNESPFNFVQYKWSFGDPNSWSNNSSTLPSPEHHFTAPGTYQVCVDIEDENGCCNQLCKSIVVLPNNSSCTNLKCALNVGTSPNSVTTLSSLIMSGQVSYVSGFFGVKEIYNTDFFIKGKLIIDDYAYFIGGDWFMDSGSEIEVQSQWSGFVGTDFESCGQMWRGITTLPSATFIEIANCKIKDARTAITVNSKNSSIYGIEFDRNLICVDIVGGGYISSFWNNKFLCTENLKPMYLGFELSQLYGTKTFCGVRAINNSISQKLNGLSGYRNIYDGLRNGIVAYSTSFECKYSDFKNAAASNFLPAGNGIYSTNSTISLKFEIEDCKFDFVGLGIFLLGSSGTNVSSVKINNCNFTNIASPSSFAGANALYMNMLSGGVYEIYNNKFNNVDNLIYATQIFNHQAFIISGTNLATENTFNRSGISLSTITGTPHTLVIDNKLKGNINSGNGLSLSNGRYGVMDNLINVSYISSASLSSAIILSGSENSEIRQNNITVTGTTENSKCAGISMTNSPNTLYCCNTITGAARDVQFSGSNTATRFKQNTMNDATFKGLLLEGSAIISPQYEVVNGVTHAYGNIWKGNLNVKNEGVSQSSLFRIDQSDETMLTTGQKYLPIADPLAWFENLPTATPTLCTTSSDCGEEVFDGIGPWICGNERMIQALETGIDSASNIPAYADQARWSHQRFVYDYMERNPSLVSVSPTLASFYNAPPPSVFLSHQIDKKIDQVYSLSSPQQSTINASRNSLDSLEGIYRQLAGTLDFANLTTTQDALGLLYNQIVAERNVISTTLVTGYNTSQTKLNQLRSLVNTVPVTYPFIAEFKAIKHAWIDYLQYGKTYAISNHMASINSIASSCIGVYGKAVTDAQALQGLLGLTVTFTDDCIVPRSKLTTSSAAATDISVRPNPSHGIWEIAMPNNNVNDSYVITVKSIDGRSVYNQKGTYINDEYITIDGLTWDNGVYIMEIADPSGQVINTTKLIKLK